MKLLISAPRCGSTVVQKEFDKQEGIKSEDIFGWHEYFLQAPHGIQMSIESKVEFIEAIKGNFLYKIHAFHLFYKYKDGILFDWFKNFYKDWEWYVLKRRDLWRAYLSLQVHKQAGRKHWHKYHKDDELKFIKHCSNIKFENNLQVRNSFIHAQKCLNLVKGKVIYLEDKEWSTGLKWNLDYEQFFNREELELLRRDFQEFSKTFS